MNVVRKEKPPRRAGVARVWAGIALLTVGCALAAPSSADPAAPKTYEVQVAGGDAPFTDRVRVGSGLFTSRRFRDQGYTEADIAFTGDAGIPAFHATLRAAKGAVVWNGEILGSRIEGTVAWPGAHGDTVRATFRGNALPPLYQRLGGAHGIAAVTDAFLAALVADPVIMANGAVKEAFDPAAIPGIRFEITAFPCYAAGGPEPYTGRDMKSSHAKLGIAPREWDAMAADLTRVLEGARVPAADQAELLDLLAPLRADIVTRP